MSLVEITNASSNARTKGPADRDDRRECATATGGDTEKLLTEGHPLSRREDERRWAVVVT